MKIKHHILLLSAARAMGGQAVLNGVMMRGEKSYAVACRRADESIDVKIFDVPSFAIKFSKFPLLRGVMGLGEAMALGYRALMHSADLAIKDEEAKEKAENGESQSTDDEEGKTLGKVTVGLSVTFSLVFFIALFIVAPLLGSKWIQNLFDLNHWQSFIVESVLRLVIFLGYLSLVSLMSDIKRVFQYHGAEHKAIAAYENDVVLTPPSAQQFTTAHVRCGTNFLLIVMVMSIVFYAGIAAFLPGIPIWGLILSRILVIPLIAGVSYEIIRAAATRMEHVLVRVLIKPGLWLQKITTRAPSDDQCEVAIVSLKSVFSPEQLNEVESRTKLLAEPSWQTIDEVQQKLAISA
ncbi:MAG: DUF1385 domain-containing protein [Acidimicrobiia bacterium]